MKQVENGRQDIRRLYLGLHHHWPLRAHRQFEDERHMGRCVVQENAMRLLTVFPKPLPMITDHNDERVLIPVRPLEILHQLPQRAICVGNLTVIQMLLVGLRKRRRWFIGIMWIVKVYPNKPLLARMPIHPRFSASNHIHSAPLKDSPMLMRLRWRRKIVVVSEASVEPRRQRPRVEHHSPDERRR